MSEKCSGCYGSGIVTDEYGNEYPCPECCGAGIDEDFDPSYDEEF